MKKINTVIKTTLIAILTLTSVALSAQTAEEVLTKFYDASGGKAAWEEIDTYTLTRSFVANAPTDYETQVNASIENGKISRRKSIMKRDFFYVVNGNNGWLKIPMGSMDKNVKYTVKDLSEGEKSNMQQEVKDGVLPLLSYDKKGFQLSFEGYKSYVGKTLATVSLMRGDDKIDYFFDKETGLIVKEVYTSPKLTETWEHTKYAETSNGIKYPTESIYLDSKANKKTTVATTLDVNQVIDPVLFIRK
jgi:putative salt-induced outer membrane protein